MRSQLERERSFAFDAGDLPRVLEAIWPIPEPVVEIDGAVFYNFGFGITRRIHLFGRGTRPGYKRRLKIKLGPRAASVKQEEKWSVGPDQDQYEHSRDGWLSPDRSCKALSAFGPLRACLVKERAKLKYYHYGLPEWVVSVDRLVPFDPMDTTRRGSVHHHIEFEGAHVASAGGVLDSRLFRKILGPLLTPLTDEQTKWVIAEPFCRHRPCLRFADVDTMTAYVREVMDDLLPATAPLDVTAVNLLAEM